MEPSQLFDPGSTMGVMVRGCNSVNVSSKDANITLEHRTSTDGKQGNPVQSSALGKCGGCDGGGGSDTMANSVQVPVLSGAKATIHFQRSEKKDTRNKPAWDHRNLALEEWVASQRTKSTTQQTTENKPFFVRTLDIDTVLAGRPCTATRKARLRAELRDCLMKDIMEFYRELILLREFKEQNCVSLRKIVKKHRKEVRDAPQNCVF